MSVLSRYWGARFDRWPPRPAQQEGYSLLVPVPGDLPVFLELALSVLATQHAAGRVETLVVPDLLTPQVRSVVDRREPEWQGPLRVVPLRRPEREMLPRLRKPVRNYGAQLFAGVSASTASHVVLHDADLFLMSPELLDERVALATAEGLDVLGADPVWDGWYAQHGLELAATWEMVARTDWLRSFPPSMHMGHEGELEGMTHSFDVTLRPQCVADPRRRRVVRSDDIVHFNYVISTYRWFQRASGTFVDDQFRLLLIRLFVDIFAEEEFDYALPTLDELAAGLTDPAAPVSYPLADADRRQGYAAFRSRLTRILEGPWTPPATATVLASQLVPFDRHYG